VRRIEKEIEFYKELFSKLTSVVILIGAGTLALWHKEGFSLWVGLGLIGFYFSLIADGIIVKKWKDKISSLED